MSLGFAEIAILAVIVLLFFGAGKIPKLMGDMASGIKEFKKGMREETDAATKNTADPAATDASATARTQAPAAQPPIIDVKAEIIPPAPPRV
jgi:sec-independent protein translocase protein TatA